jgi:hypothetical protein
MLVCLTKSDLNEKMGNFSLEEILLLTENVHSYLLKIVHSYLLKYVHRYLLILVHFYLRKNVHCYLPFTIGTFSICMSPELLKTP